jgi:uncharacterized membrane protein YfcA
MEPGFLGIPGVDSLIFSGLTLTSFCTAVLLGVTGSAGGLLLLGVLALVFPPAQLIPIHTFVMLGDNVSRVAVLRRYVMRGALVPFAIGAGLGALAGGQIFMTLPAAALQAILGVSIIAFTWMPKIASAGSLPGRFGVIGFIATFAGIFVSAVGMLVSPFVAAAYADRHNVIGTFSAMMSVVHLCKLVAFGLLGASLAPYLPLILSMIAGAAIGNLFAGKVLGRMPERAFRVIFKFFLTVLALRILWLAADNAGIV